MMVVHTCFRELVLVPGPRVSWQKRAINHISIFVGAKTKNPIVKSCKAVQLCDCPRG